MNISLQKGLFNIFLNPKIKIADIKNDNRINMLIVESGLQTGSIDWILSNDEQFYLMEVSPTGAVFKSFYEL